jgi:hypothetical protein
MTEQAETTTSETGDDSTDWKAEAEKWQALARKNESRAKSNVAAAQQAEQYKSQLEAMLKAAGVGAEGEIADPAQLTDHLERAQAVAWQSGVELQLLRLGPRLGADAEALLDSNSFIDSLDDLVEDDPRSPEFAAALEAKVKAAIEKNPKYRADKPSRTTNFDGGPRSTAKTTDMNSLIRRAAGMG